MKSLPIIILSCAFVSGSLSADELGRLDKAYARKIEQVVKPVNRTYLLALERLKKKAMQNNDLALANKIDGKIKAFKKLRHSANSRELGLEDKVQGSVWMWHVSNGTEFRLVFSPNGKAEKYRDEKKENIWSWKTAPDDKSVVLTTADASYKITFDKQLKKAQRYKGSSQRATTMLRSK